MLPEVSGKDGSTLGVSYAAWSNALTFASMFSGLSPSEAIAHPAGPERAQAVMRALYTSSSETYARAAQFCGLVSQCTGSVDIDI